ncbi:MAG TPA: hypothetical protein VGC62_06760 [Pseudomonas sp.]|uniref:hypothetical protein n=1 Tax=Pseudomonas sp. TaxID=306 RepID=UPI002ED848DC
MRTLEYKTHIALLERDDCPGKTHEQLTFNRGVFKRERATPCCEGMIIERQVRKQKRPACGRHEIFDQSVPVMEATQTALCREQPDALGVRVYELYGEHADKFEGLVASEHHREPSYHCYPRLIKR